jgi:hypothetical protein
VAALDETPEGQETLTPTVARDRRPSRLRGRMMLMAAVACVALGAVGALYARAYFLKLRSGAIGAYREWATSEPAKQQPRPVPQPRAVPAPPRSTELPDPPKPMPAPTGQAVAPAPVPEPVKTEPPKPEPPKPEPAPEEQKVEAPKPEPDKAPEPAAKAKPLPLPPPSRDVREWRDQIDGLIADGKPNVAKNRLRDRIAVDKNDAWSHLRLGDVYADAFHFRRDAFREWDAALAATPALAGDAAFRKSICEAVDTTEQGPAQEFLHARFDADGAAALLAGCVRATAEPARVENTSRLLAAVAGAERPELGMAAMRLLDVGKSCAQKKAAVETIRRLRYVRARSALVKLDRQRLAHAKNPPPAVACFGTTIAETIEELK